MKISETETTGLTHIIQPNSYVVVQAVKDWNDNSQQDLRHVTEKRDVSLFFDNNVPPLLQLNYCQLEEIKALVMSECTSVRLKDWKIFDLYGKIT